MAHNFLFVLPVEAGLGTTYGDGLETLQALDAEDQYNLTIVEPTFAYQPWYDEQPRLPQPPLSSRSWSTELVPWVDQHLATTGTEQNWLMGFSKSGYGGQDLLLRYPGCLRWQPPGTFLLTCRPITNLAQAPRPTYGTEANFAADYQLTPAFVAAHKAPFLTQRRIWIGGYSVFAEDLADYAALLASQGILYTTAVPGTSPTAGTAAGWRRP